MMELGACVSLVEKCHPLGCDRMQQVKTKAARFAKVTGRSDRKLESSRVFLNMPFVYDLFPFVFPSRTMVGLEHVETRGIV